MNYTGSSCEDIFANNPETLDKEGYYRINGNQWTLCNITSPHVLVWVEVGEELLVSISVQEMLVLVDGVKRQMLVLVFVDLTVTLVVFAHLPTSPLMEHSTRGVVEQKDIRKVKLLPSMVIPLLGQVIKQQLMTTMLMGYYSLMAALVDIFGHMLLEHLITVQMVTLESTISLVLLMEEQPLPLLWELTITVNQDLLSVLFILIIYLLTHCGMDLAALSVDVARIEFNHGFLKF